MLATPHLARPWPADGEVVPEPRTRVGGFHPGYTGYGAEDTDFAVVAAAAGVPLAWRPPPGCRWRGRLDLVPPFTFTRLA